MSLEQVLDDIMDYDYDADNPFVHPKITREDQVLLIGFLKLLVPEHVLSGGLVRNASPEDLFARDVYTGCNSGWLVYDGNYDIRGIQLRLHNAGYRE